MSTNRLETLDQFRARVAAADDVVEVPDHLRDEWARFCEGYEQAGHDLANGLIERNDTVTVHSTDSPDGATYPRCLVDELNAIFREHGRKPIATR